MARITSHRRTRIKRLARQNRRNRELIEQLVTIRRNRADIRQEDIANKMGISQSQVSRFENYAFVPRLDQIRDYATAVDCEVHFTVTQATVTQATVTPVASAEYSFQNNSMDRPLAKLYASENKAMEAAWHSSLRV